MIFKDERQQRLAAQIVRDAEKKIAAMVGHDRVKLAWYTGLEKKSPDEMMLVIAKSMKVHPKDIFLKSNKPEHVDYRRVCVLCLNRLYPGITQHRLGNLIGYDHTTVQSLLKTAEDMLFTNDEKFCPLFYPAYSRAKNWQEGTYDIKLEDA